MGLYQMAGVLMELTGSGIALSYYDRPDDQVIDPVSDKCKGKGRICPDIRIRYLKSLSYIGIYALFHVTPSLVSFRIIPISCS